MSDENRIVREIRFVGKPEEFVFLLRNVGRDWRNVGDPVWLAANEPPWPGGRPYDDIVASFRGEMVDGPAIGWTMHGAIRTRPLPRGITLITLGVKATAWAQVEPYWRRIVEALDAEGWIQEAPTKRHNAHEQHVALCARALALPDLTKAEHGVVLAGAAGASQRSIAKILDIAPATVKVHIRSVKEKLKKSQT